MPAFLPRILPLLLALGLPSLPAQVSVSTSLTAPSDNLLVSFNTGANAGIGWRADSRTEITSDNWRDVGELFVSSSSSSLLDAITVVTSSGVNSPARGVAFTLTLYSFGSGFSITSPTVLATLSGTTPSGTISNGTFLTFDVPDIQLTSGMTYGFLLHFDAMADNRTVALRLNSGSNAFSDGRLLTRVNASDGTLGALSTSTSSLEFYIQTAAIPEPASFSLIAGLGLLACVCARRPRARRV